MLVSFLFLVELKSYIVYREIIVEYIKLKIYREILIGVIFGIMIINEFYLFFMLMWIF